MNFKKLKRLLSVMLSVTMVLSSNMTGLASEVAAPTQANPVAAEETQDTQAHEHIWELVETKKEATADQEGLGTFQCTECGETRKMAIAQTAAEGDAQNPDDSEQTTEEETEVPAGQEVATIGTTRYDSIEKALTALENAANGTELTLAKNVHIKDTREYTLANKTIITNGNSIILDAGAKLTLNDATVTNTEQKLANSQSACIVYAQKGSSLTVNGGSYTTADCGLFIVQGDATINGGEFISTAEGETYYATSLFIVDGGTFAMTSGTARTGGICTPDTESTCSKDGMYGIYVLSGGKVALGEEDGTGPTIESKHSVIGTNYHTNDPAVSMTIHGGTYKSHVNFDAAAVPADEKNNTVIYITGASNVAINGGTFEAVHADNKSTHVISIPLSNPYNTQGFRNISISGGTFTSGGDVFHTEGVADSDQPSKDLVSFNITNGDFSSDVSKYLFGEYKAQQVDGKWQIVQQDDNVATVGTASYPTLHEAIVAAKNGTTKQIGLKKDAELTGRQTYDLTGISIETNGFTIRIAKDAKIVLKSATITNKELATFGPGEKKWGVNSKKHVVLNALEGSTLLINGGSFKTKGVNLLSIAGDVTIKENASFECTATNDEAAPAGYYDAASMIAVNGKNAVLKMLNGSITATTGNGADLGLYGIYVESGATAILGDSNGGPTLNCLSPAVSTNNLTPDANITIHNGTYKSSVKCTAANEEKFNAVLYLTATSNVVINDGTFIQTAAKKEGDTTKTHVISIPYTTTATAQKEAIVNLTINGGTFKKENSLDGSALYIPNGKHANATITIQSGKFCTNDIASQFMPTGYSMSDAAADGLYEVTGTCSHGTLNEIRGEDPTCWKEGLNRHYECSNCHKKFWSKGVPVVSEKDLVIAKENHVGTYVPPVEGTPTCGQPTHNGYYYCEHCEYAYETLEKLNADDGTEGYKDNRLDLSTYIKTTPHTLGYKVTWTLPEADRTVTGKTAYDDLAAEINAEKYVKVTKECSSCHNYVEENVDSTDYTLAITSDANFTGYTCADTKEVTFTATLTENNPSGGISTPITATCKITVNPTTHSYGDLTVTAAGSGSLSDYKPGTNGTTLKATRKCVVCEATETATAVTAQDSDMSVSCENDQENLTLPVTATFTNAPTNQSGSTTVTIKKGPHSLTATPYKKATCTEKGNILYYTCSTCRQKFKSPDSETPMEAGEEEIAQLDHNFGVPKFEWDETKLNVNAVFTCINCHGSVTLTNVEKGNPTTTSSGNCADDATWSYPVSVKFDREYVKANLDANGKQIVDDFGDPIYEYDKKESDPDSAYAVTCNDILTKQAILGHDFEVELAWKDKDEKDESGNAIKYHNINKGIVATLTCKNCGGKITINSADNKTIVDDDTEIRAAHATIKCTPNYSTEAGCVVKNCFTDGVDVYDVTVTCRTDDKKGEKPYGENLRITTPSQKTGHNYYVVDANKINWSRNGAFNDDSEEIVVELICANDSAHNATVYGAIGGAVLGAAEKNQAPTCTVGGEKKWPVTIKYAGETITQYGAQKDGGQIYAIKTARAKGHTYDEEKGTWNWDDYIVKTSQGVTIDTTGEVYYDLTCQDPACSCEQDENDPDDGEDSYKNSSTNRWVKRYVASGSAVTSNIEGSEEATCTDPGKAGYIAVVKDHEGNEVAHNESEIVEVEKLGHKWDDAAVTWDPETKGWTPVMENDAPKKVTVPVYGEDGQPMQDESGNTITCTVPAYQFDATIICSRCEGDLDGSRDTIKGVLGETSSTAGTNSGAKVQVTVISHREATCLEQSKTVYKATILDKNDKPMTVANLENKEETSSALGHAYTQNKVYVDWTTLQESFESTNNIRNKYTYSVNAYYLCDREASETGTEAEGHRKAVPADKITVTREEGKDCTSTDGVEYTATITSDDGKASITKTYTYQSETGKHEIEIVPASDPNGNIVCDAPYYPRHYHCKKCGKNFETANLSNEVEISFEGQPHAYGKPVFSLLDGESSAQATFTCTRECGKTVILPATVGETFILQEQRCSNATGGAQDGIWIYPVSVEFEGKNYEGEFEKTIPGGSHMLDENGVCKSCQQTFIEVSFLGADGAAISTTQYSRTEDGDILLNGKPINETDNKIVVINAPNRVGYTFTGWSVDGAGSYETDAVAEQIMTVLKSAKKTQISVAPLYDPESKAAALSIQKVTITAADQPDTAQTYGDPTVKEDATVGQKYGLTIAEGEETITVGTDSYEFSYWANDSQGKNVLSTDAEFGLYISSKAQSVYAIYVKEKKDVNVSSIVISNKYAEKVDGAYKVCFAAAITLPDDVTEADVVDRGFLYGTKQATFNSMTPEQLKAAFVVDIPVADVKQKVLTGTENNILTVNLGTTDKNLGANIYARGYVRYKRIVDGKEQYFVEYTEVAVTSYNELTSSQEPQE